MLPLPAPSRWLLRGSDAQTFAPVPGPISSALASQSPPPPSPTSLAAKTLLPFLQLSNLSLLPSWPPSSPRGLSPLFHLCPHCPASFPQTSPGPLYTQLSTLLFLPSRAFCCPSCLPSCSSDYPTSCHPPSNLRWLFLSFSPINLLQRQELLG